jgi:pilus assembly protein Flp/PilA
MLTLASSVRNFLVSEEGPTAVEYAVMLALIIVVCLIAIDHLGDMSRNTFRGVSDQLSGS